MPAAYNYSSTALETQLSAGISNSDLSMTVDATTGFPAVPFNLTIDRGEVNEEIVTVTAVVGLVLTVLRQQNGTLATSHLSGAKVTHQAIGRDLQLSRDHEADSDGVHGLAPTDEVVGRVKVMALEGKTIDGNLNTILNVPQTAVVNLLTDQGTQDTRLTALEAADVTLAASIASGDAALDARVDVLETTPTAQVFTAGGTWNKPTGLRAVRVRCVGGGGAGGGAGATGAGQVSAGSGGQGGHYAESTIPAASLGASETVTVGAGGSGVSGADGNAGGTSSFGVHVSAGGGAGGVAGAGSGTVSAEDGAQGATVGTGQITVRGSGGGALQRMSSAASVGGFGGGSVFGGGGAAIRNGNSANAGWRGGGGSGAARGNSQAAAAGGGGGDGIVIVEHIF